MGKAVPSPTSMRMRAAVLTPMPGIEVRSWERGWASRSCSILGRQQLALVQDRAQRGGQDGDDQRGGGRAGHNHSLLVERREDVLDQALRHAGCLGSQQCDQSTAAGLPELGGRAEAFEQGQECAVVEPRAQDLLQRGEGQNFLDQRELPDRNPGEPWAPDLDSAKIPDRVKLRPTPAG